MRKCDVASQATAMLEMCRPTELKSESPIVALASLCHLLALHSCLEAACSPMLCVQQTTLRLDMHTGQSCTSQFSVGP